MSAARPTEALARGVLCALVLAPGSYSRNRFYELFQDHTLARTRRRAARISSVVRHLMATGAERGELLEEATLPDGQVMLRYRVPARGVERRVLFSRLEAATLRCALARARGGQAALEERDLVEEALTALARAHRALGATPELTAR